MKRILIVDDEESVRQSLSAILSKDGYAVQTASSFAEMTPLLDEYPPDAIILDVLLPGRSGIEILKYLRHKSIHAPVIVITGAPDMQSARESLRHGAYDYIAKPFSLDALRQAVQRAVQYKEGLDAHRESEQQKRRHEEELERQVRERATELEQRNLQLAALNRIGAILSTSFSLEGTLQAALTEACGAVRACQGAIYLLGEGSVQPVASFGTVQAAALDGAALRQAPPEAVALSPEEIPAALKPALPGLEASTAVLAPLTSKEQTLGLLAVGLRSARVDQPGLALLSEVGRQMGVAVQNAWLYEEAVARQRRMEAIIQNMAEGVLVLDRQNHIVLCNDALKEMLRIDAHDVSGCDVRSLEDSKIPGLAALCEIAEPEPDAGLSRRPPDTSEGDAAEAAPREIALAAPLSRVLLVSASRLLGASDKDLGLVKIVHDITPEREIERAKSDFVSIVSHELRTPLFYIKGFAELLLQGKAEDPTVRTEFLTIIRQQTEHLNRLVEDLLDSSQIENGTFRLKEERVPIADLIRQSAVDAKGIASQADVALDVEVDDDLPEVRGDFLRLKQVMMNLIGNAVKFSAAGASVCVRGFIRGGEVWVQVEDQGPGIPAKHLQRIFDKFYQAEPSSTRSTGGAGLGLHIAAQIIERLGGRIWAESEVGRGSCFTFTLPLGASNSDAQSV